MAETFSPSNAIEAGFLDQVVEPRELEHTARSIALAMLTLDMERTRQASCGPDRTR